MKKSRPSQGFTKLFSVLPPKSKTTPIQVKHKKTTANSQISRGFLISLFPHPSPKIKESYHSHWFPRKRCPSGYHPMALFLFPPLPWVGGSSPPSPSVFNPGISFPYASRQKTHRVVPRYQNIKSKIRSSEHNVKLALTLSSRDEFRQSQSAVSAIIFLSLIPMSGGGLVVGRYPLLYAKRGAGEL